MLRLCIIGECNEMETVVDGSDPAALPNLEVMSVYYMKNLRSIICEGTPLVMNNLFLCCLKSITFHTCPMLTTIFTLSFIDNLTLLEEIKVQDCPKVTTLISHDHSSKHETQFFLPRLTRISLLCLPELVNIFNGLQAGQNLLEMRIYYCPKLRILSKKEFSSTRLVSVKGESRWWKELKWNEEGGWEDAGQPHFLNLIFSPINEDEGIIMAQSSAHDYEYQKADSVPQLAACGDEENQKVDLWNQENLRGEENQKVDLENQQDVHGEENQADDLRNQQDVRGEENQADLRNQQPQEASGEENKADSRNQEDTHSRGNQGLSKTSDFRQLPTLPKRRHTHARSEGNQADFVTRLAARGEEDQMNLEFGRETVCPNHSLELKLNPAGAPYTCSGCHELGFGQCYRCENRTCSYVVHVECAEAVSFAFHEFLKRSYFEFYEKPPGLRSRYCDACGKDVLGYVYHCNRTGYDLHPCCLKLKKTISDEHGQVTLKLSDKVPSKCAKCKRRNVVGGVRGWCYVSSTSSSSSGSGGGIGDTTCYHVGCVKELILENWKRGYFSQQITTSSDSHSHQLVALESMDMEIPHSMRRRSSTARRYSKLAVVTFKLIFSAIFGNPISATAALIETLASD